jgi:2-polyprenyl-3-methyl-5-hydroxy-6-metoxy-1,4-benzoquinol methylase
MKNKHGQKKPTPNSQKLTEGSDYTERLANLENLWWKKLLKSVNPYRRNIRNLCNGYVLDIGCGIGRNLRYMGNPINVGVDNNAYSVSYARKLGFDCYTTEEFLSLEHFYKQTFDTLLISHVLEHMTEIQAVQLILSYMPCVKPSGQIIVICPQLRGFKNDDTHVTYMTPDLISNILDKCGFNVWSRRSFPFPRIFGNAYIYNEHIVIGQVA